MSIGGILCLGPLYLLFMIALVVVVVLILRQWTRSQPSAPRNTELSGPVGPSTPAEAGTSRALDILKERYARGEITKEQYDQMRRDLMS